MTGTTIAEGARPTVPPRRGTGFAAAMGTAARDAAGADPSGTPPTGTPPTAEAAIAAPGQAIAAGGKILPGLPGADDGEAATGVATDAATDKEEAPQADAAVPGYGWFAALLVPPPAPPPVPAPDGDGAAAVSIAVAMPVAAAAAANPGETEDAIGDTKPETAPEAAAARAHGVPGALAAGLHALKGVIVGPDRAATATTPSRPMPEGSGAARAATTLEMLAPQIREAAGTVRIGEPGTADMPGEAGVVPTLSPATGAAMAPHQVVAKGAVPEAAIDTRRAEWIETMVARIETAREAAEGAGPTRLRLAPAALGGVEVAIRHEGERVHLHFQTETAAARQLLSEAQPRLAEIAEARGLRLGQTSVADGQAGPGGHDPGQRRPPEPAPPPSRPAPTRAADAAATADADARIA